MSESKARDEALVKIACVQMEPVIIPEECVADRAEVPHRVNLFDMEMISADVLPLEEVLEHLRGLDRALYAKTV